MGFFSWKCAKSGISIPSVFNEEIPNKYSKVILVTPKNRKIKGIYDGYGRINNRDIFEEIMKDLIEDKEVKRIRDKFFKNYEENMKYIKIVRQDYYNGEDYSDLTTSKDCEYQGWFYPESYIEKYFEHKRKVIQYID